MKILAHTKHYFPGQCSGGESMMHNILKYLQGKGHEVSLLVQVSEVEEYDGIPIFSEKYTDYAYSEADLIFTHLLKAGLARNLARKFKKPIIDIIHSDHSNPVRSRHHNNWIVYNSQWIKDKLQYTQGNLVVRPPVKEFSGSREGKYITLVNCNDKKGGGVLIELAKRMPGQEFLGVIGGYGDQVFEELPNLTYVENSPNMAEVYAQTKILIVPSVYESFGMAAMEALSAGIPVIAAPTEGLKECLSYAGRWAYRDEHDHWVSILESLQEPRVYRRWSALAKARFEERQKQQNEELEQLNQFIQDIYENGTNTEDALRQKWA